MSEETYSQEQQEDDQEQQEDDFIKEFELLTQKNLTEYEKANRDRINSASKTVKDAFNKKWKKVGNGSYFQPVTTERAPSQPFRMDPVSNNYQIDGKEGFWEVIFSAKGNPHDPDDVILTVNGECLQIQRNVPVILPGRYLECADHGTYPVFKQLPNEPRKIVSHVKFFPYTVLRIVTKADYDKMKREGDRLTKEQREKEERAT